MATLPSRPSADNGGLAPGLAASDAAAAAAEFEAKLDEYLSAYDATADWLVKQAGRIKSYLAHQAEAPEQVNPLLADVARKIVQHELQEDTYSKLCEEIREILGVYWSHGAVAVVFEPAMGLPPVVVHVEGRIAVLDHTPGLVAFTPDEADHG